MDNNNTILNENHDSMQQLLADSTANLSHTNARRFQPSKLKQPRDLDLSKWHWIHATDKELVLEIGAGKGMHAIQFAKNNPNSQIIAIERTSGKFTAFDKSEKITDFDNLYPVHADAIPWSVFVLPPKCLNKIFILYPNPERNNLNQQWLNMPFFEFLLSRLMDGGTITLASNIEDYINNAHKQSIHVWHLPTIREPVQLDSKRTHFEVKYLARHERCEQLIMTKPENYVTQFDSFLV